MEIKDKIIFYKSIYYFIIIANILYFLINIVLRNLFWDYILGLDKLYENLSELEYYKSTLNNTKFDIIYNFAHFSLQFSLISVIILTILKIIFLKNSFSIDMFIIYFTLLLYTFFLFLVLG
jgi:hypothetical protein